MTGLFFSLGLWFFRNPTPEAVSVVGNAELNMRHPCFTAAASESRDPVYQRRFDDCDSSLIIDCFKSSFDPISESEWLLSDDETAVVNVVNVRQIELLGAVKIA